MQNNYISDIKESLLRYPVNYLSGKTVFITGATGLLGGALVDYLLVANKSLLQPICIIAQGRKKNWVPFLNIDQKKNCSYIPMDLNKPIEIDQPIDYVFHIAGKATPHEFANDPIGVLDTNVVGTKNVLDLCDKKQAKLIFVSTAEIYGEQGETIKSEEDYFPTNPMQKRNCYPISKICAEAYCTAYGIQKKLIFSIARLSHAFGPTMTTEDNRVASSFLKDANLGRQLSIKNPQVIRRNYIYAVDAASALVFLGQNGLNNRPYNISNDNEVVTLQSLASTIAHSSGVSISLPDSRCPADYEGCTSILSQLLTTMAVRNLGWFPLHNLRKSVQHTLEAKQ